MANIELPDFDGAANASEASLSMEELSECHGLVTGFLCAHPDLQLPDFQNALIARHQFTGIDAELSSLLASLLEASRGQLADQNMQFAVWLPSDDEPLDIRANALGAWCSGFITGLVEIFGNGLQDISEPVSEIIRDLGEIARAGVSGAAAEDEEENAFAEIVEFVRVTVLLVQEELCGVMQGMQSAGRT